MRDVEQRQEDQDFGESGFHCERPYSSRDGRASGASAWLARPAKTLGNAYVDREAVGLEAQAHRDAHCGLVGGKCAELGEEACLQRVLSRA